jgi:hypothetical protein
LCVCTPVPGKRCQRAISIPFWKLSKPVGVSETNMFGIQTIQSIQHTRLWMVWIP